MTTDNEKTIHGVRPAPAGAEGPAPDAERPGQPGPSPTGNASTPRAPEPTAAAAAAQADPSDLLAGEISELVEVAAQRDEYLALAQRTQADFENYRKRMAREAAAAQERGTISLAKELLPALDNLSRALDGADADDPLLKGVGLVRAELGAALARAGIESFSPAGEPFDPALHEAVATAPQGEDGVASGTVVEVYQDGYRLGATILRPARVVVAA
jgi:molecular chaperone GrpE